MGFIYVTDTSPSGGKHSGNEREPQTINAHTAGHVHSYSKITQFPFRVRNRKRIGTLIPYCQSIPIFKFEYRTTIFV